jgi:hypothetical protein
MQVIHWLVIISAKFANPRPIADLMTYQEQLNPWVIHQLLPNLTRTTVSRFRRRNEAEAYLKVLRQIRPNVQFAIAFEVNLSSSSNSKAASSTV